MGQGEKGGWWMGDGGMVFESNGDVGEVHRPESILYEVVRSEV